MKKPIFITTFTVAYSILLSLGIECLLYSLGTVFGVSLYAYNPMSEHPIFFSFCIIAGIISLLAIIVLFILNYAKSEKLGYIKKDWIIQSVIAIFGAILLIKPWEILFDFLYKIW